jgi:histidinol phosphatase-like PHP family hydrolase
VILGKEREGGGGVLGTQDLHVHTDLSDGDLSIAEVVEIARELGVTVGIADHVSSRNLRRFVSTRERLSAYLDALDAAPVFRSGELCWCDSFASNLPPDLLARFDYLVGSNHGFALPDGTFASPWWKTLPPPWDERPDEVMESMVHNLCDMVRAMPIAIAAHSTMLPPALLDLEPDLHAWWTEEREDRFIEAARDNGVALEISNRYRLPHDRFLRKAREAGARFSLGSDGHHRHQIARLEWAVDASERAGITAADLFVAER